MYLDIAEGDERGEVKISRINITITNVKKKYIYIFFKSCVLRDKILRECHTHFQWRHLHVAILH